MSAVRLDFACSLGPSTLSPPSRPLLRLLPTWHAAPDRNGGILQLFLPGSRLPPAAKVYELLPDFPCHGPPLKHQTGAQDPPFSWSMKSSLCRHLQVGQSSYTPQARGLHGSDDDDDSRSVAVATRQRSKKKHGKRGAGSSVSSLPPREIDDAYSDGALVHMFSGRCRRTFACSRRLPGMARHPCSAPLSRPLLL